MDQLLKNPDNLGHVFLSLNASVDQVLNNEQPIFLIFYNIALS